MWKKEWEGKMQRKQREKVAVWLKGRRRKKHERQGEKTERRRGTKKEQKERQKKRGRMKEIETSNE